jgi:DNA-binding transcriptional LysR family regulator
MDVTSARTFLEIVKTGSFVKAAVNLRLTQTAISARIRVLEDQLGRPLFSRKKTGASLTVEGERFLRFATTMVQAWEQAQRAVGLPEGKEKTIALGAQVSLWDPLITKWLVWMRHECPQYAVHVQVANADELLSKVQDGSLDAAVLYAAPRGTGIVAELLFEEKLILVRTSKATLTTDQSDYVRIDWGPEFAERHMAAFPDQPNAVVSASHGPLALNYILAMGGSGYFRRGFVKPCLEDGRLLQVSGAPEFSYSAYIVHSAKVDETAMSQMRAGLRHAASTIF